jgi:hypothetical protein
MVLRSGSRELIPDDLMLMYGERIFGELKNTFTYVRSKVSVQAK